jgi:hypothetical protein
MHVSPSLSSEETWSKQWSLLRQQLTLFFSRYNVSINRKTTFQAASKTLFQESFSAPLPTSIQIRAAYECRLVRSVRRQLADEQLILRRTADGHNVFYLGLASEFQAKADDYLKNSTSFEKLSAIDEHAPQQTQLEEMLKSIDAILQNMRQNRQIGEQHVRAMQPKKVNVQLPYLYFLPEPQPDGSIVLQSFISHCNRCPIQPLAHFLHEFLRPLYESHTQSTSLSNGADLIEKLVRHCHDVLLPHTRFVTLEVRQVYLLVSHQRIVDAVGHFLSSVLTTGRHQNLSIDTVQRLVELVLRNNLFTYQGYVYRHVKGSPCSLPLTRTLVDIYLWHWQTSLVSQLGYHEEFYGRLETHPQTSPSIVLSSRYYDKVLLTWGPSNDRLQVLLDELNQKHPDTRMATTIGSNVHFLGAHIENRRGELHSRVHHDPTAAPFLLPYVIGHPRLSYRQWLQWALRRAVRYCTTMEDFDEERRYIELTLLAHGYSTDFVNMGLSTFFAQYFAVSLRTRLERPAYESLRRRLLSTVQLERQYRKQQQQWRSNHQSIHLHYLYDWGPRCQFNRKFKQLWSDLIRDDAAFADTDLKLQLSSVHCHPLNALLTDA